MLTRDSHCTYCGTAYTDVDGWPRTCAACQQISFRNPVPVTIVLVPVDDGVLVVRRAIEPHRGKLALPGGYVDFGETWQAAGAREVWEEAGVVVDASGMRPLEVFSAPDNTLIIAGIVPTLSAADLPPFAVNSESSERRVLTEPEPLAFDLHSDLLTRYLNGNLLGYTVQKPAPSPARHRMPDAT
ncbi:MAG: NUDIX domain-containing protein [Litorilinea sp.]